MPEDNKPQLPFGDRSFVVNPPIGIACELRLRLEATAFAIQTIYKTISDIEEGVKPYANKIDTGTTRETSMKLACDCWTVVDQTHMLTELLALFDDSAEGALITFRKRYSAAREIRNGTRHIRARLKNLASRKDAPHGIFGVLTFLNYEGIIADEKRGQVHAGWHGCLLFGGLLPSGSTIKMAPDGELHAGICSMTFSAFDHTINLSELKADVMSIAGYLETHMRHSILAAASKAGVQADLDKIPQEALSWSVIAMRATWDGDQGK